ncbi:MAG TPA: glycogen debranching N-terminal domain-containing protein [Marmoricola sp.]|nr:glycogen debranching N-terminal domain-containing protein [Marmoricola sp.]
MSAPWLYAGAPDPVADTAVTLMEGTTFCISDAQGDVGVLPAGGLFVRDTRVLSTWTLSLAGRRLDALRVHHYSPHATMFVDLAVAVAEHTLGDVLVTRARFVGDGMREDITVRNTGWQPVHVEVRLEVDADFADLFEVKEGRAAPASDIRVDPLTDGVDLSVERDGEVYGVTVTAPGAHTDGRSLCWPVELVGQSSWSTTVQVTARLRGRELAGLHRPGMPPEEAMPARRQRQFRTNAPRLTTADRGLAEVLRRSIADLATLRIFDPTHPELPVIAAGAPWFMALFGRDSLLTSIMLLPVDASLAQGTLATLGSHQGRSADPVTEEQPGRILHELRFGPSGTLALGDGDAYYGTADATALFVVAAGELNRWHPELVTADLVAQVDKALDWMLGFGVGDGSGFIEYHRQTEHGLVNQGWKDSWDGINFADGTLAEAPIALAEVQAYAYAAFRARAEIAAVAGDSPTADLYRERAARLRSSYDEAFWLPERGWYAVGLDRDHRPIDALTSNIGHCLWTGIVPEDRAGAVVSRLIEPDMFSGWGIRTLSSSMGAFNPMSYHNGSVWPHDTALCIAGMARYGYMAEAQRVAIGLLDAAAAFGGRLPELFAGFSRDDIPVPVPYPAACSPQAWASAAPIELLRALLRLEPAEGELSCTPDLPERFLPLVLGNIAFGANHYDVHVSAHGWEILPSTAER